MNLFIRRQIQNTAIFLVIIIGFGNLFAALPLKFAKQFENIYKNMVDPNVVATHGILSFMLGILMLLLGLQLIQKSAQCMVC